MESKKTMLIINPVSGMGVLQRKLWNILNLFSKHNIFPTVLFTQKRGDAKNFAAACPKEYETIICAGGDGTLNEVISGLMENPYIHSLGYLPVGTTNDLANSLGLSKNVEKAALDIINGKAVPIDIGTFNGRYFNYIASFGAFTEASYNAPQEAKNLFGHGAYILEGIMSLGNIRPYNLTFSFDDKIITGDFIFGGICNTTSLGGVLKLNKQLVALNDGKLEVLLIKAPQKISQLQRIIDDLIKQKFNSDLVSLFHTAEVKITTKENIDWTLDGEHMYGKPVSEIKVIPGAVNLILPKLTE